MKPVVLWGHAFPRGGAQSKSDILRDCLRRLSKNIIVYTESQSEELRKLSPTLNVSAAPNALYKKSQMNFDNTEQRLDVIYVGRLVKEKKPCILLKGFIKACEVPTFLGRLVFVGEGSEREELEKLTKELPKDLSRRVLFLGHVSGHEKISKLYSNAFVSVSPGYVGLSITQSFSFGVPMIISENEPHAPEIEAAKNGDNSSFFNTDDITSLSKEILSFYHHRDLWAKKGPIIVESCKNSYSTEVMAERICNAVINAK